MVVDAIDKMGVWLHLRHMIRSKRSYIKYRSTWILENKERPLVSNLGSNLLTQVPDEAVEGPAFECRIEQP